MKTFQFERGSECGGARQQGSFLARHGLLCVILVLVLLAYSPNTLFRFAFADDYAYLAIHAYRAWNPFFAADGRPLGGLMAVALFTVFDTVGRDAALRLIALAEFLAALLLIYRSVTQSGLDRVSAALLIALFSTAPAVQIWMIWGVAAWQLPALLLSLMATLSWKKIITDEGVPSKRHGAIFFACSMLAMLIYQPFALASWPLIFVDTVLAKRSHRYARLLLGLGIYFAMLGVYFLLFKYIIMAFVPAEGPHGRASVVPMTEVLARLWWFVEGPLRVTFTPLSPYGDSRFAVVIAGGTVLGLCYFARRHRIGTVTLLALSAGTLCLAHLPALAASETTALRTQVSLVLAGDVLIVLAVSTVLTRLSAWIRHAAVLSTSLVILAFTSYSIMTVAVWPHSLEWSLVEQELNRTALPTDRPILLVGPAPGTSLSDGYCGGGVDIGCASSAMQFALPNMVRLWMRERGIDSRRYRLLFLSTNAGTTAVSFEAERTTYGPIPDNAVRVDFERVINAARAVNK